MGKLTNSVVFNLVEKMNPFSRSTAMLNSERVRQQRIAQSPQFQNDKVVSHLPKVASNESMSSVMKKFFFERALLKPNVPLPYQSIDPDLFDTILASPRVTWLGHSSLFIEIDGKKLLVDPVFDYASPWFAKRLFSRNVSAPIDRESLPTPDAIIISHDHYDHLEEATIRFYADKAVTFIVPLAVGRHLEKWGVAPEKIEELDWWQSVEIDSVELTATPANHNSGRTGFDSNATLWASWVIKGMSGSLFYSGDTAYDNHFKQIGDRFGPFDIAFIEVAANVKQGRGFPVENWGHMQAKHTARAYQDLQAKMLMPFHWSTYELFAHYWDEPIDDLLQETKTIEAKLVTPMVGESFELDSDVKTEHWWSKPDFSLSEGKLDYQGQSI